MTRIFYTDASVLSNEALFEAFLNSADGDRIKKIESLKKDGDKRLSLAVYICLAEAMRAFGIDDMPKWSYLAKGKPCFKEDIGLYFSLSHSEDIAIAAVSEHEVGIDIERINDFRKGVCRKYFSQCEAEYVLGETDYDTSKDKFFRIWTLKEAFSKMTGGGIGAFKSFEIIPIAPLDVCCFGEYISASLYEFDIDGYKIALCTDCAEDDIGFDKLNLFKLLIKSSN